ncbi:hypothetical protein BHM03_00008551 [Ensete ventricosum]|nr:hypothetical protein BHM03_00008551 [Ensete ventricosum]
MSTRLGSSRVRNVARINKCWVRSSGEFSKRVPFPIPGCDFYTRRSVIVRTFALSVVGVLERGGCMVASSTEASYTGSTVGLACTTSFIYGRSSSTVGVTP